jgi:hypothetical protein
VPNHASQEDGAAPTHERSAGAKRIRGWVYVITNEAMPDLVKVGFSTKDPELRAKKLGSTGNPHPYAVAYDALVYAPRDMERRVHEKLADVREGKEWFRCSVSLAVAAIRALDQEGMLIEQVNDKATAPSQLQKGQSQESGPKRQMGATTRLSSGPAQPKARITAAATYRGFCAHCRESFSVTLTRHDTVARCPSCFRSNDVSEFLRSQLML